MRYKELLNNWIDDKKKYVRNSTYCNYLCLINTHISSYFGDTDIENIEKKDIKIFMSMMQNRMGSASCQNIQKILKQSFEYAIENEYISKNPYVKVKLPRENRKEIEIFSQEEIKKILQTKKYIGTQYNYIVEIAYRTGMRIGELMTLKWTDIDFQYKFIMVKRTFSKYENSKPVISDTKTKSSRRRIDLDDICIDILKNIEHNGEFVFSKKDGSMISYTSITKHFKKMCELSGVKYRNFHTLRHTHASVLLSNGVHPKIVQERLGHSKISITLDTYSHLIPTLQSIAVDVFNNI